MSVVLERLRRRAPGAPRTASGDGLPRLPAWLATGLAAAAVLAALALVAWGAGPATIDVGAPGDRLLVAGMHGDERADGRAYRWTRAESTLSVPGLGGAGRVRLTLGAAAPRPDGQAVPLTVLVDGVEAGVVAGGPATDLVLEAARPDPGADRLVLTLRAPTIRPPNDARDLGILLDRVQITPLQTTWAPLAWGERWLALVMLTGLLALAVGLPARRWAPAALWLALAGALVALATLAARPFVLAAWPWLALGLLALMALANAIRLADALASLLQSLERPRLARLALGLLVAAHVLVMTLLAARIDWIGHADYADNAVVARNLIAGRGYTVDYVAQFYLNYPPTISHPADVWPLLQPTLIAGSFLLLGATTFAAKLPNIVVMAGLIAASFWLGAWLFGRLAGLGAALVVALDPFFFEGTLFPLNDLVFGLLALLVVGLAARLGETERAGRAAAPWRYGLIGLCAGLLVVAKPSGALLALGVAAWWLWGRRPGGAIAWPGWRGALVGGAVAVLVVSPVVGRSLLTFGALYFTTETYDAWVLKWEPPDENIYRLMADDLPHPRRLVGLGLDRVIEAVGLQFFKAGRDLADGVLLETGLLLLAGLGLVAGRPEVRRCLGGLAWALVPYTLFVLIYWHYELRYFVFLVPWLAVLACGAVATLLAAALDRADAVRRRATVALLTLGLVLLLAPRLGGLVERVPVLTSPTGEVIIGEWLAANTPPEAVVMSRVPWQLTWHSQRRGVMIPLGSQEEVFATMRRYGVGYLLINHLNRPPVRREALRPLYDGQGGFGMIPVFELRNPSGILVATVYRVPPEPGRAP